jgi:hypothetical protein
MKKIYTLLLFLPIVTAAQNLVPNPSFEEFDECPETLGAVYACSQWQTYGETSDYFNGCSSIVGAANPIGFQQARTGSAYAGFVAFSDPPGEYREFLGIELTSPVTPGSTYYISIHLNKAEGNAAIQNAKNACNNIGVRLFSNAYDSLNPPPVDNFSHAKVDTIFTEEDEWLHLYSEVVFDSAYGFLAVGNFFTDSQTDLQHVPDLIDYRQAYYYVDDVCLSTNADDCGIDVGLFGAETKEWKVFPSPFTQNVQVSSPVQVIRIVVYNSVGIEVASSHTRSKEIDLSLGHLSNGIYLIEVISETKSTTLRIIKNN